jgi:hypothetical protein
MPTKNELAKTAAKYISTKKVAKPTAAKKDNTRVARKRVNELLGDEPNYDFLTIINRNEKKSDSTEYARGFREQLSKNKRLGKATFSPYTGSFDRYNNPREQGRSEAYVRRKLTEEDGSAYLSALKPKAMVRDSSIPLAPTQFPD